jgi:hypothetical protein
MRTLIQPWNGATRAVQWPFVLVNGPLFGKFVLLDLLVAEYIIPNDLARQTHQQQGSIVHSGQYVVNDNVVENIGAQREVATVVVFVAHRWLTGAGSKGKLGVLAVHCTCGPFLCVMNRTPISPAFTNVLVANDSHPTRYLPSVFGAVKFDPTPNRFQLLLLHTVLE